ncbi:MAG: DUF115 domain-containing protein [Spirochaetales bacterium]|nr:DUF115 domain-containing protein [Spirochaetales bacterium]
MYSKNLKKKDSYPTISINNIQLHSNYNPKKEAEKFIRAKCPDLKCSPSAVIILGAGLGYLTEVLRKVFSGIKIITIYYSNTVFENAFLYGSKSWHNKLNVSLSSFLKSNLGELDIEGLLIIEWPPSAHAVPLISKYVNRVMHQTISELTGNFRTTLSIGKRWIKNTFYNFLYIKPDFRINFNSMNLPVLITASGPSLNSVAEVIKKYRDKYILLSLPSSLLFLKSINVEPDITIVTDPGFYSFYHFKNYFNSHIRVAMPLSAPPNLHNLPFHFTYFVQPYFFEKDISDYAKLNLETIPSGGTVAASALELALRLTSGQIIFAGLDFCYSDIKSHVEPNSFDFYYYLNSTKIRPLYSETFLYALETAPKQIINNGEKYRISETLSAYAGYFNSLPSIAGNIPRKNIFRLLPSPVELNNINNLALPEFIKLMAKINSKKNINPFKGAKKYPSFKVRKSILRNLLKNWLLIINKAELKLISTGELAAIIDNIQFINLSYYIVPQLLIELKRSARLKGKLNAMEKAALIFKEEKIFLNRLIRMVEKAEL